MSSSYAFRYEHCDIPEGMTVSSWRAARARPRRRRRLRDLLARR